MTDQVALPRAEVFTLREKDRRRMAGPVLLLLTLAERGLLREHWKVAAALIAELDREANGR